MDAEKPMRGNHWVLRIIGSYVSLVFSVLIVARTSVDSLGQLEANMRRRHVDISKQGIVLRAGLTATRSELEVSQRTEMFVAMVTNGLGFFTKAASELASEPSHSVAHFATGLELLLKARLFTEHWTLICDKPQTTPWATLYAGNANTIGGTPLLRVMNEALLLIEQDDREQFLKAIKHRNRVLHLRPHEDRESISSEQCAAWYRLNKLLLGPWKDTFRKFQTEIEEVESQLKVNLSYLRAKFNALAEKREYKQLLGVARSEKRLFSCTLCANESLVAELDDSVGFVSCIACQANQYCMRLPCGCIISKDALLTLDCEQGGTHHPEELHLFPEQSADTPYCGECCQPCAIRTNALNGWLCALCWHLSGPPVENCSTCSRCWVGLRGVPKTFVCNSCATFGVDGGPDEESIPF